MSGKTAHYRTMIRAGKAHFPRMNTVRVWLSFDAYISDRERYLTAIREACSILTEEGLRIIPIYLNGWFGFPSFGGFTAECAQKDMYPLYEKYLRACVNAIREADILMHDIADEPFNNVYGYQPVFDRIACFMEEMIRVLRTEDTRPITVGSQCCYFNDKHEIPDVIRLAPSVDVLSLHPYNQHNKPVSDFATETKELLDSRLYRDVRKAVSHHGMLPGRAERRRTPPGS